MRRALALLTSLAALAGCNLNLADSSGNRILQQLTPTYTGANPRPWYLFEEHLSVGDWLGGLGVYVGGTATYANFLTDFASTEKPRSGSRNIRVRYAAAIAAGSWAGATFTHTPDFTAYASTPGRDLGGMGFARCVFYAACPEGRKVQFYAQGANTGYVQLGPDYARFEIPLPSPAATAQTAVKDFFGLVFDQPNSVGPVTVHLDDLRYE